jgi:hypothetical protein
MILRDIPNCILENGHIYVQNVIGNLLEVTHLQDMPKARVDVLVEELVWAASEGMRTMTVHTSEKEMKVGWMVSCMQKVPTVTMKVSFQKRIQGDLACRASKHSTSDLGMG